MFKGEEKNPITMAIITLVTCNLFGIVWLFQTAGDLNKALGRDEFNPMIILISSLLCLPAMIFWAWKMTAVMPEIQQARGVAPMTNGMIIVILFWFFAAAGVWMFQTELNKTWGYGG